MELWQYWERNGALTISNIGKNNHRDIFKQWQTTWKCCRRQINTSGTFSTCLRMLRKVHSILLSPLTIFHGIKFDYILSIFTVTCGGDCEAKYTSTCRDHYIFNLVLLSHYCLSPLYALTTLNGIKSGCILSYHLPFPHLMELNLSIFYLIISPFHT